MRLSSLAFLLAVTVAAAGCYETPKPNCAFLCGAAAECPDDYMCGGDGRCHLVMSGGALATCEEPIPVDASESDAPIDVADFDAGPDAMIDSGVPTSTRAGLISIQDVSVHGHTELGHGAQVTITYGPTPNVAGGAHDYDDRNPATQEGCTADLYDLGAGEVPPVGLDEGAVSFAGTSATIPPCTFYAGIGYLCIAGAGMGGTGDVLLANTPAAGAATIVDMAPSGYTFSNADVGRYISITGSGSANNDGQFPIVGVDPTTNAVVYGNPLASSDTTFTGSYTIVAAAGPVPGAPDPLLDSDVVNVTTTPGGDMDFEAIDVMVNAGDAFTLDTASQSAITLFPFGGTSFSLACGPSCGSSAISAIAIETTDGVVPPGAPDYYMPPPSSKVAVVQCAFLSPMATVPSGAMAIINAANPQRVQTTFIRANPGFAGNADGTQRTTVIAGHGIIGFSTLPPGTPDAGVIDAAPPVDADTTPDAGPPDADTTPDASPPDAFVCSPDLSPADDGSDTAHQALMFSEINPGDYIELYNNTSAPIALGGSAFQFCSPFNYCDLSTLAAGVTVPAHGYATVPWPTAGTCFSSFADTNAGGEIILYISGATHAAADIMQFVCWGSGHGGLSRKTEAESVGKWSGACAPAITGGSIHRIVGSDGLSAADYNTSAAPSPMNCTP
jgi:hypothetical protein